MSEIPDSLRLLFETDIEADGDRYVIEVPDALVADGSLTPGETYRVAVLAAQADEDSSPTTEESPQERQPPSAEPQPSRGGSHPRSKEPPVDEGETRTVEIESLGDQGDGIAKVERGFIVIVPGTKPGDRVEVEVTDVKETVAFAEPIDEPTVR